MTEPQTSPHHHGALREALIEAGYAILSAGEALTLRKVAAKVGVSHAAPAHHFDGLAGLLTAIAARAFTRFSTTMETKREAARRDPTARLQAICAGYLEFATTNAGLFHLMFVSTEPNFDVTDLATNAARAYAILSDACAPFVTTRSEAEALELTVWSLVHGYASLGITRTGPRKHRPEQMPQFTDLLAAIIPAPLKGR